MQGSVSATVCKSLRYPPMITILPEHDDALYLCSYSGVVSEESRVKHLDTNRNIPVGVLGTIG